MAEEIQYGTVETTRVIDSEGSTVTEPVVYRAGVGIPKRHRYEIRHRADKTDIETLTNIVHALISDPLKIDKQIRFEYPKTDSPNVYHIVECYTVLEY